MAQLSLYVLAVVCFGTCVSGTIFNRWRHDGNHIMDVSDFSVYYNVKTNETIRDMMPRPWYKPGWLLRLPFTGGPCSCEGYQCKCCTGIRIQSVGFDRQGVTWIFLPDCEGKGRLIVFPTCTKLTFEPSESTLNMDVTMNGESIYRNSFSARNPPPFCVPIPVPYLPPGLVDMCVRFFDISVMDQKLHVCMDWDTRIDKAPVLVLHFDCMDMGFNGVGLSKPGSGGSGGGGGGENNAVSGGSNSSMTGGTSQVDSDIFDPVTESLPLTTAYPFNNSIKYI